MLVLLSIVLVAIVAIFLIVLPVVRYVTLVSMPFAYKSGFVGCSGTQAEFDACIRRYQQPPVNITGYGSIGYYLFGVGSSPYKEQYNISAYNESAIVHFQGAKISYGEVFFQSGGITGAAGILRMTNISLTPAAFGAFNFSISIENQGTQTIDQVTAVVSDKDVLSGGSLGPGNFTYGGITWVQEGGNYGGAGGCPHALQPSESCSINFLTTPLSAPSVGRVYQVLVEAFVGDHLLLYRTSVQVTSVQHINDGWVQEFIAIVNSARNGTATLRTSPLLNGFAKLRLETLISNYGVTHFGYEDDFYHYFNASNQPSSAEEVYFNLDNSSLPGTYAAFVGQYAPAHWSALTNPSNSHYGFYVGTGPAIVAIQPCNVTEFAGGGINMEQYLTANGCQYRVETMTWLVIELT